MDCDRSDGVGVFFFFIHSSSEFLHSVLYFHPSISQFSVCLSLCFISLGHPFFHSYFLHSSFLPSFLFVCLFVSLFLSFFLSFIMYYLIVLLYYQPSLLQFSFIFHLPSPPFSHLICIHHTFIS